MVMENDDILKVKNYLTYNEVKGIYSLVFNKNNNIKINRLTGGLKNSVYLIENNEEKVVLKVASANNDKTLSIDRNTMWWEAEILKKLESIDIPSPKLLYSDNSCSICPYPFIFMTYIDGKNYFDVKKEMSDLEIKKIEYEIGVISKKITSIVGKNFFIPAYKNKKINNNYEFMFALFQSLFNDSCLINLKLERIRYSSIFKIIESFKKEINDVDKISLCHADLWDGNILIKNKTISGVLDYSDLYYGDELFTFYFRNTEKTVNKNFLNGYGKTSLTYSENIRVHIYKLYTILKMIIDVAYKGYGRYQWMYDDLEKKYQKIINIKRNML